MLFNSLSFAVFFPITVLLFFALPGRFQALFLLLASCFFYAAYIPGYLLVLVLLIVVDYIAGIAIEDADESRKSLYLTVSLFANLGLLGFFKYSNFAIENVVGILGWFGVAPASVPYMPWLIPLGLSFHTFQSMSYTMEVRTGKQRAERNFLVYALYVMFFPQLAAGPIERPQHMLPQLHQKMVVNSQRVVHGLQLMLWGFIKKIAVADRLGPLVDSVYLNPGEHSGGILIVATVCFAVQIYCDFSGYTDIARGCAEVLGYELTENFRRPFFATSLPEFWQRWHISLTSWLRDYVFYPLRFMLPQAGIMYTATIVLFAICGLWHGAAWTYIVFGLMHGLGMSAVIYWRTNLAPGKKGRPVSRPHPANKLVMKGLSILATVTFVCFTFIYFRSSTLPVANSIAGDIFGWLGAIVTGHAPMNAEDLLWLKRNCNDLSWGIVLSTALFVCEWFQDRWSLRQHGAEYRPIVRWSLYYAGLATILVLGKFEVRPFVYFQF